MKERLTNMCDICIKTPDCSLFPALRSLWKEAFDDTDEFLDIFFKTAFSPKRCLVLISDNTVAAALYWFNCSYKDMQLAYIYAVATAREARGQGFCHRLMNFTHEHLKKLGYDGTILSPGNDKLFGFYESMGYKTCSYIRYFLCENGCWFDDICDEKSFNIHKISKDEYASLRRDLLPPDGIIQENENLDFLEMQADFYAGRDFLLAAYSENNCLHGIELLGNADSAPHILYSLGYSRGHFRTPGKDTPFAMLLPFTDRLLDGVSDVKQKNACGDATDRASESIFKNIYFGLAFD